MSKKSYPLLTCKEVKTILKNLGFTERTQKGSHNHWVHDNIEGQFRKVTVDCPKAPFGAFLIKSMIRQSGVTKKAFYAALDE